jgi:hypothetical protein
LRFTNCILLTPKSSSKYEPSSSVDDILNGYISTCKMKNLSEK